MSTNTFASAVRVTLTFLETLTPAKLRDLANGKLTLALVSTDAPAPTGGTAAKTTRAARTTTAGTARLPDTDTVRAALMTADSRDAAAAYLNSLNLKVTALRNLAKALNIRGLTSAAPKEVVDKIVATTTGAKLKASTLQAL